jgi:N-acetylmuramoyl-L-alanine amidase
MKVCVDAGHGGVDPGAIGEDPFRLEEKEINLAVASFLEEELWMRGHETLMTRRQDRTLSLGARAEFANRHGARLFVSIHANAAHAKTAQGMEVYCFPGSDRGGKAANHVLKKMLQEFPKHKNRGVKEVNFAVLRMTHMPAILVECEFLTNAKQLRFLSKQSNQMGLARAIADGIDRYSQEHS